MPPTPPAEYPDEAAQPVGITLAAAVSGRRSVRRFLPDPVPQQTIAEILARAARAPSGTNTQPWLVHVVTGDSRDRVAAAVTEAARNDIQSPDYDYHPMKWFEPYLGRRRKIGYDLYDLVGVDRRDYAARKVQSLKNFSFFGAPVGLFLMIDRRLRPSSWIDVGMFAATLMLTARDYGLETCPQAAWVWYGGLVRETLGIGDDQMLLCAISLGKPDPTAPENRLTTERAPVDQFTTFHDR